MDEHAIGVRRARFVLLAATTLAAGATCNMLSGATSITFAAGGSGGGSTSASSSGTPASSSSSGTPASSSSSGTPASSSSSGTGAGDAGPSSPPSCKGLGDICGPSLDEDCCASPAVPGGMFSRTLDGSNMAMVSPFRLDRFEVTVGRFRRFVTAYATASAPKNGAGANPYLANSGWDPASSDWNPTDGGTGLTDVTSLETALQCVTGPDGLGNNPGEFSWTTAEGSGENLPINCVTWYEAFAFCAWDGGFLPTEAEWLFAAVGGTSDTPYPWGSTVPNDTSYANFNCNDGSGTPISGCTPQKGPARVGEASPKGDSPWGQADLAGNAFELTLDWYGTFVNPCTDCGTLSPGSAAQQVIRGGSWYDTQYWLAANNRVPNGGSRASRSVTVGFRCARAPLP